MALSVKNMLGGGGKIKIENGSIYEYYAKDAPVPPNNFVGFYEEFTSGEISSNSGVVNTQQQHYPCVQLTDNLLFSVHTNYSSPYYPIAYVHEVDDDGTYIRYSSLLLLTSTQPYTIGEQALYKIDDTHALYITRVSGQYTYKFIVFEIDPVAFTTRELFNYSYTFTTTMYGNNNRYALQPYMIRQIAPTKFLFINPYRASSTEKFTAIKGFIATLDTGNQNVTFSETDYDVTNEVGMAETNAPVIFECVPITENRYFVHYGIRVTTNYTDWRASVIEIIDDSISVIVNGQRFTGSDQMCPYGGMNYGKYVALSESKMIRVGSNLSSQGSGYVYGRIINIDYSSGEITVGTAVQIISPYAKHFELVKVDGVHCMCFASWGNSGSSQSGGAYILIINGNVISSTQKFTSSTYPHVGYFVAKNGTYAHLMISYDSTYYYRYLRVWKGISLKYLLTLDGKDGVSTTLATTEQKGKVYL